jgi:hypothetical protein
MNDSPTCPGRMKTAVTAAVAVFALAVPSFVRPEAPAVQTLVLPGIPLELSFRALQPGEAILVRPREDPSIRRIDLRLRTQKRRIEFDGKKQPVLLGIDVAAKPQSYFMEITTERRDGSKETVFRKLMSGRRNFRKRS